MIWKRRNPDDTFDEYYSERPQRVARDEAPLWIHLGMLILLAAATLLVIWAIAGWPMVSQFLKAIIAPVGLIWIGLGVATYFALVRRAPWPAFAGLTLWLFLTIAGNCLVRQALVHTLEHSYAKVNHAALGSFDYVVVLGGGTNVSPAGRPQLVCGGDRVLTAARLFLDGQAGHLIATGRQRYKASPDELDRSSETRNIWVSMKIPEDAITTLAGGNTREELEIFAQWLRQQNPPTSPRIGLVTSAWHMPRAMALADEFEIDCVPIPCDFLSRRFEPDPALIIPSADNLHVAGKVIHEWVGRWVGR